jgi:hypothetical protein
MTDEEFIAAAKVAAHTAYADMHGRLERLGY